MAAARTLTERYAQSRLAKWNVRATAAGDDCSVLLIQSSIILDDTMIESLHYGLGPYDVVGPGGVQHFCSNREFRGAVYRDSAGHTRRFGAIESDEADRVRPCH